MKNLKNIYILIFCCFTFILSSQCSFQYISNDTIFQDYFESVFPRESIDEVIVIGSRINRGIINDSIYNAPVFKSFDYCGNIIKKTIYDYIGNYRLKHTPIPTHNTYKEEPVGNTAIRIKEDEFLIVDKAVDTTFKNSVMILFKINENGVLKTYKTLTLNNNEANQTTIKNVLELKNGNFLVILWDYSFNYIFYYFDENLDFLNKKSFSFGRGIRALKEVDNGEFICTSLAYDNSSFQFYRFDSIGEIKWIVTPYNIFGSAREILIQNNKIYITGGTGQFGVFLICDIAGNILKEFKYDTFYCQQKFCSAYLGSDNSFIVGGYIEHCQSTDSSGTDIAILKIDTSGTILWDKLYDFRNSLGTSGPKGKYNDYGGFLIAKTNDGGIIANGMSRYNKLVQGGILHEDALLIKTEPLILTSSGTKTFKGNIQFELSANLISYNLNIIGPVDLIKNWYICSLQGKVVLHDKEWSRPVNLKNIDSGTYTIIIIDRNNYQYFFKFVKI